MGLDRSIPDYTGDKILAQHLADQIQQFYFKLGYYHVRVWLEKETTAFGSRLWNIRSNLVFDCASLDREK